MNIDYRGVSDLALCEKAFVGLVLCRKRCIIFDVHSIRVLVNDQLTSSILSPLLSTGYLFTLIQLQARGNLARVLQLELM